MGREAECDSVRQGRGIETSYSDQLIFVCRKTSNSENASGAMMGQMYLDVLITSQ